jgi:hypothetical protein
VVEMMKKKKGYRNGGKIKGMMNGGRMKAKGMKNGGKMKAKGMKNGGKMKSKMMRRGGAKPKMTLAQLRAAANKMGMKLVKKA